MAREMGLQVDEVYADEGISGRTDVRPEFQAAIEYCEIRGVDYFITWSTSRFARNKEQAALYKSRLRRSGTQVVFVSAPLDRETDSGWMVESVYEIFDELHSRQIAADTLRSMIRAAERGRWVSGLPPHGYESVGAKGDRRLQPHPLEAPLVREVFRLASGGMAAPQIAKTLNDAGRLRRGRRWDASTVRSQLRNGAVIGRVIFNRIDRTTRRAKPREQWVIVDAHDPIIGAAEWNAVQARLGRPSDYDVPGVAAGTGSPRSGFVWTGMLKCGACGESLRIESAKGRSKRYHYYNCRAWQMRRACAPRRIPARELDAYLLDVVLTRIFTRDRLRELLADLEVAHHRRQGDGARRRADLAKQHQQVSRRLNNIYDVIETMGRDAPDLGDLTRRLRALNAELSAVEAAQADLEAELRQDQPAQMGEADLADFAAFLAETIRSTHNAAKVRAFLRTFVEEAAVVCDTVEIRYRPDTLLAASAVPSKSEKWLPVHALLGTATVVAALPMQLRRAA